MAIKGKVAAILNERDLIINKGADAGVQEGMKFKVIEPELEIRDPDTREVLGVISKEKIRVKVVEVQSKYSIGKTYETYLDYMEPPVKFPFLPPPPRLPVTRVRTLKTGETPDSFLDFLTGGLISVGDLVVQVEDDVSA